MRQTSIGFLRFVFAAMVLVSYSPVMGGFGTDPLLGALEFVRERYADFGPTLAGQKLRELHGVDLARETLRKWMAGAGIWLTRDKRRARAHQPRRRRACLGELVQIDGSPHGWFEDRGPDCSLLVYVDNATGTLMELRFVEVESTFDYFVSTDAYLKRHGKPVAFHSDKHRIFHLYHQGATDRAKGLTQFGRPVRPERRHHLRQHASGAPGSPPIEGMGRDRSRPLNQFIIKPWSCIEPFKSTMRPPLNPLHAA